MRFKVGLCIFSGLTFSLHIFYRRVAYRSFILWLPGFTCAAACLWNAGSATGMVTATMLLALLYLFQTIAKTAMADRAAVMKVALGAYGPRVGAVSLGISTRSVEEARAHLSLGIRS